MGTEVGGKAGIPLVAEGEVKVKGEYGYENTRTRVDSEQKSRSDGEFETTTEQLPGQKGWEDRCKAEAETTISKERDKLIGAQ